ncbi:MAG: hypothetical protein K2X99_01370 [Gemmatimonadaceae bacterium]|nr:hypothetical protein [Gemmatimonadaceae bacterium]
MRLLRRTAMLSALASLSANAQLPVLDPPTAKDCRAALRIVERGRPQKKEEWAWGVAIRCSLNDAAPALATLILSTRTESDTSALFDLLAPTWHVVDERLLDAAVEVIGDPSATINARTAAAMTIGEQVTNGALVFEWSRIVLDAPECSSGVSWSVDVRRGIAPSATGLRNARERLRGVIGASTTPGPVRNAAACAVSFVESALRGPPTNP